MTQAEQFIKDCTRRCSNVVYYHNRNFTHGTDYVEGSGIEVQYSPWITPDQALRAVEIAREEMIAKAYEWLKSYRQDTPDGTGYIAGIVNDKTIEDFKKQWRNKLWK